MPPHGKRYATPAAAPALLAPFLFMLVFFAACANESEKPLRIGYVGGLTGRAADLGTSGRDGVILAVEELNTAGGLKGRAVELRVQDDRQDAEVAQAAVRHLIKEGVVAIIGPMTSAMAAVAVPIVNEERILMMSPTASTNELSGKDDYFFRIYPASRQAAERLAEHVYTSRGIRRMAAIYDLGNRAYTESMFEAFRDAFQVLGGTVTYTDTFTSGTGTVFSDIVTRLASSNAEGLLLIANAMDTGLLCQRLRHAGNDIPVFSGEWSVTEEILRFGARAVDGLEFFHTVNKKGGQPEFLGFQERFRTRFGYEPGFASVHAYDSARILLTALARSESPEKLKETLSLSGSFEGLQGPIEFNAFGDVMRRHFLMTIRDGRFEAVEPAAP